TLIRFLNPHVKAFEGAGIELDVDGSRRSRRRLHVDLPNQGGEQRVGPGRDTLPETHGSGIVERRRRRKGRRCRGRVREPRKRPFAALLRPDTLPFPAIRGFRGALILTIENFGKPPARLRLVGVRSGPARAASFRIARDFHLAVLPRRKTMLAISSWSRASF